MKIHFICITVALSVPLLKKISTQNFAFSRPVRPVKEPRVRNNEQSDLHSVKGFLAIREPFTNSSSALLQESNLGQIAVKRRVFFLMHAEARDDFHQLVRLDRLPEMNLISGSERAFTLFRRRESR